MTAFEDWCGTLLILAFRNNRHSYTVNIHKTEGTSFATNEL
jgi:hypothetical protein